MIPNKNCTNCGSRNTYAVPSRNRQKDINGVLQVNPDGSPLIVRVRRCRACGEDYDSDPSAAPKLSESAMKLVAEIKEYRRKKAQNE